jgi:TIR domain
VSATETGAGRGGNHTREAEPGVFISYRREDAAGHAGRLYDWLTRRFGEHGVFIDVVAIEPGKRWRYEIQRALEACWAVLVVIGPQWLTPRNGTGRPRIRDPDDVLRYEVGTALHRDDVEVIPVLVEGARMPKREDLPEELSELRERNAAELSDVRWRYDVGLLGDTLENRRLPSGERSERFKTLVRFLRDGLVPAVLVGMAARWIVGEPKGVSGDIVNGALRQGEIWALVGATLAVWIAISRGEPERIPTLALAGLVLGAIGGALGGAILNVPKQVAKPELLDREVVDALWIASRATHGLFIGALLGLIWIPRGLVTGMAAGLLGGALIQLLYIGLDWNWRDSNLEGIAATGIECMAIVGFATAALLVRSWRTGAASVRTGDVAAARSAEP